jgi:dihydroxyacetone kinase
VLAAIRHCSGRAGTLLVVKNYTGDRLNFGLAAEQARREALDVRMVIVADDIALPDASQPRGIAGTVLMHKYVGYLAAQGRSLDDIASGAEQFAGMRSSGAAPSWAWAYTTSRAPSRYSRAMPPTRCRSC